jgi:uncharacterized protein (DUF2249 family)
MTQTASRIDVRTIAPRDRHPLIFSTFNNLATGQALELVNDHDPRPLYYQFNAQMPGQFAWEYLEQGPELFRVAITRTQDAPRADAGGSCCGGGCGGNG